MTAIQVDLSKWMASLWIAIANLGSEWTLYQVGIIIGCYLVSRALNAILGPRIEARVRRVQNQPRLIRALAGVLRRLPWLLLAMLLGLCVLVLQATTWPSNRYFVTLAASLSALWAFVGILSRIIRKRSLRKIVEVTVWGVAALYATNNLEVVIRLLDWLAISFGGVRLSVLTLLKGALVLGVVLWAGGLAGDLLDKRMRGSDLLSPSLQVLVGKIAKAFSVVLAILLALSAAGIDVTVLTVFSGAFGLGLGFGLQKVASNLASGIIMLADRSVKPGDVIQLGNTFGWITSLRGRYVSVATRDGAEYLIPNEKFVTEQVVSWSHTDRSIRLEIKFGVAYQSDPHVVRSIVTEAICKLDRVLLQPEPVCHLVGFGESSLDFVARFWIIDPENGVTNMRGAALLAVWDVLKQANIAIPFPQREITIHTLKPSAEARAPA